MYDVFVTYAHPADPVSFDAHYADVHVSKVLAMPHLVEFTWGHVAEPDETGPYLIARMTFADADAASASMDSSEGRAAVDDLAAFATAGVVVHNVPRVIIASTSP